MKQRVVDDWLEEYDWPDWMANPDAYVYHAYQESERDIGDLSYIYAELSDVYGADDLRSEAFIATHTGCGRFRSGTNLKQSSHVHWNVQTHYQRLMRGENIVDVYGPDGDHVKTIEHATYRKQKERLTAQGMVGVSKRRIVHDPVNAIPKEAMRTVTWSK